MSRQKPKKAVTDTAAPPTSAAAAAAPTKAASSSSAAHLFWSKQPVVASEYTPPPPPQPPPTATPSTDPLTDTTTATTASDDQTAAIESNGESSVLEGVIDPLYLNSHKHPFPLPANFEWYDIDIHNTDDLTALYTLLRDHYVEDSSHSSRVEYSREFLQWALTSPNHISRYHVAVRLSTTKKLVAFICGTRQLVRIRRHTGVTLEISFLCVHAKLRRQRLAPVLIKEITRRISVLDTVKHAVYTAGVLIHQPLTHCTYYHRPLNVASLVAAGFIPHPALLSTPPPRTEVARTAAYNRFVKRHALPTEPGQSGGLPQLAVMREDDVAAVHSLLSDYLSTYSLVPLYDIDEVRHWFLPRTDVVYSYVLYEAGTLVAFVSFQCVPRLHNYTTAQPITIRTANASYHVCRGTATTRAAVLREVMCRAKAAGFDVYSALDMMDFNDWMVEDGGRFLKSNGGVYYYLFNYQCQPMRPHEIAMVVV